MNSDTEKWLQGNHKKLQRLPCKGCWCLPNIEYKYVFFQPQRFMEFFQDEQSHQKLAF